MFIDYLLSKLWGGGGVIKFSVNDNSRLQTHFEFSKIGRSPSGQAVVAQECTVFRGSEALAQPDTNTSVSVEVRTKRTCKITERFISL